MQVLKGRLVRNPEIHGRFKTQLTLCRHTCPCCPGDAMAAAGRYSSNTSPGSTALSMLRGNIRNRIWVPNPLACILLV